MLSCINKLKALCRSAKRPETLKEHIQEKHPYLLNNTKDQHDHQDITVSGTASYEFDYEFVYDGNKPSRLNICCIKEGKRYQVSGYEIQLEVVVNRLVKAILVPYQVDHEEYRDLSISEVYLARHYGDMIKRKYERYLNGKEKDYLHIHYHHDDRNHFTITCQHDYVKRQWVYQGKYALADKEIIEGLKQFGWHLERLVNVDGTHRYYKK